MKEKPRGVLGRIAGALDPRRGAPVSWQPSGRVYPRLIGFNPRDLVGRPGLYLLWHLGVRPQWLRTGYAADLASAVALLVKTPEVLNFEPHDGPFISWSFCQAEESPGLVNFLVGRLNPVIQDLAIACDIAIDPKVRPTPCALPAGTNDIQPALNVHADRN